jgi:flagellar biosynthesis/type III secretory pathway chaperone
MNSDLLDEMTHALRAELQEYGALLGLLEDQQKSILRGEPDEFVNLVSAVHEQVALLGAHRSCREKTVQCFARRTSQPETSPLSDLLHYMPQSFGGMIKALIEEINVLIGRTQRRLRQNHLLLARCVSSAQQAVAMAGGAEITSTYGRAGMVKNSMTADPSRLAVA